MNSIRKKTYSRGFTLTELIIAIIVMGILISIAVPTYTRSIERAKCAQGREVLKSMRTAALSYFSDKQTFAGVTVSALENQVGARFFSGDLAANAATNENQDWYYSIAAADATSITLQATRRGGPHAIAGNATMTVTDNILTGVKELWGGSYPRLNPVNW